MHYRAGKQQEQDLRRMRTIHPLTQNALADALSSQMQEFGLALRHITDDVSSGYWEVYRGKQSLFRQMCELGLIERMWHDMVGQSILRHRAHHYILEHYERASLNERHRMRIWASKDVPWRGFDEGGWALTCNQLLNQWGVYMPISVEDFPDGWTLLLNHWAPWWDSKTFRPLLAEAFLQADAIQEREHLSGRLMDGAKTVLPCRL